MPEISRTFQMVNGKAVPLPAGGGADPGIAARVKALEDRFDPEGKPIALSLATRDTPGIVRIGAGLNITLAAPDDADSEDVAGQDAGISLASDADASEGDSETSPEDPEEGDNPEQGEEETPGVLSLGSHASADADAYGRGNPTQYGHVRIVDNFEEELSATDGVALSPKGVKRAWDRLMGVAAVDGTVFTSSGSWTVPETGQYKITCVGGGGKGGNGGNGVSKYGYYVNASEGNSCDVSCYSAASGGGGGGGGVGQVVTQRLSLTKGKTIAFTVGGPGGATTFSSITALAGGNGGNGGAGTSTRNAPACYCGGGPSAGGGGAGGTSYGSVATDGGSGVTTTASGGHCTGGLPGTGAISSHNPYGNGGNGGSGATATASSRSQTFSGSAGSAGKQGCIIIESPISAA